MAKANKNTQSSATAPTPTTSTKRSAASEIDDLFASKKSKTASAALPPAQIAADEDVSMVDAPKRKNSKGKGKAGPETIVDTSASIEYYRNAPAPLAKKRKAGGEDDGEAKMNEQETNFMDSRGATRRRTDDGLAIYDQAELKIGLGGGELIMCTEISAAKLMILTVKTRSFVHLTASAASDVKGEAGALASRVFITAGSNTSWI
ncbi:hypothetical protein P7C70_g5171, partial [Phenoliferia sp. Uapishka_3]